MDLKINGIGFGGKKEVMYALKKASKEAKNAEIHRASCFGPRPVNRMAEYETCKAKMDSYLDMATYDDKFSEVIEGIPTQDIGQELRKALEPKLLQWGTINPLEIFSKSLVKNCSEKDKTLSSETYNKLMNFFQGK